MTDPRVLALVPARGGSKRLPGKNSLAFAGHPLIEWTFAAARDAHGIGRIVFSSDDDTLLALAALAPGIVCLRRPADLASDKATSVDVALHALDEEAYEGREWDILVLLQPTSPLRARGRIEAGIAMLAHGSALDAVVGIARSPVHPFQCYFRDEQERIEPVAGSVEVRAARSQDLPPAFVLTGSFYAIRTQVLRRERRFIPEATGGLLCDDLGEDIDIDTIQDFRAAERLAACGDWIAP